MFTILTDKMVRVDNFIGESPIQTLPLHVHAYAMYIFRHAMTDAHCEIFFGLSDYQFLLVASKHNIVGHKVHIMTDKDLV